MPEMELIEAACRAAHAVHNDDLKASVQAADLTWDGWKSWIPVVTAVLASIERHIEAGLLAGAEQMVEMDGSHDAQVAADAYDNVIKILSGDATEGR